MKTVNADLRAEIARNGLMVKEVANELGISANSFSRILSQSGLREGRKYEIRLAIGRAARKKAESEES